MIPVAPSPNARPPGPKPHFLIGNFPLGRRDPLGVLTAWAREYGDIFYYRAGWIRVYFLNHPDYIESVLAMDRGLGTVGRIADTELLSRFL